MYTGKVLDIVDGVVTQKVNRDGSTVRHNLSGLARSVKVGDLLTIIYRDGQTKVDDNGRGVGVGR